MKKQTSQKFLVDAMLRKLGKFMRILGLNTEIADSTTPDSQILQQASNEDRILITMDKMFFHRTTKHSENAILISASTLEDQLVQTFSQINYVFPIKDLSNPASYSSRCTSCNSLLTTIAKEKVKDRVPNDTFSSFEMFWSCNNDLCGKIYWQGSHWKQITQTIKNVRRKLLE